MTAGKNPILGYDCLMIPGAKTRISVNGGIAMNAKGETQCGGNNGIGTDSAGTVSATICCKLCILSVSQSNFELKCQEINLIFIYFIFSYINTIQNRILL